MTRREPGSPEYHYALARLNIVEKEIAEHQESIAALRTEGFRLKADLGISPQDATEWLVKTGLPRKEARELVIDTVLGRNREYLKSQENTPQ